MASADGLRKRRKTEKKAEAIGSDSGSSHNKEPVDWWDEFCKRVNGTPNPLLLCFFLLSFYFSDSTTTPILQSLVAPLLCSYSFKRNL